MAIKAVDSTLPWYAGGGNNGVTNLTRAELQGFVRGLLEDTQYRAALKTSLLNRSIAPAVETMLWHYAYGKPADTVNLNVNSQGEDLSSLSTEELCTRAEELREALREASEAERAIDITPKGNNTIQ